MAQKIKLFTKNDVILIVSLTLLSLALTLVIGLWKQEGSLVVVSVDGRQVAQFPLDENTEYEIHGYDGGKNLLVIKDSCAFLEDASCPDRLCMNMGKIRSVGQSIICLPNRVVVEIEGDNSTESEDLEYDVIVG